MSKRSFRSLATRPASNAGVKMTINGLDGKPTEDWILVRGIDSDEFQTAKRVSTRAAFAFIEAQGGADKVRDSKEYIELTFTSQRNLVASLVIAWSFEEPCNSANVLELITESPYISQQIDEFSGKRERFVAPTSSSCEPLLDTPSDSTAQVAPEAVLPSAAI